MKKRLVSLGIMILTAAALYAAVPACGNKNNNNGVGAYPYQNGINCVPGQICQNGFGGGAGGVPLINGTAVGLLDNYGSTVQLTFGAANMIAGQAYSGPVNISGVINFVGNGVCPPGQYQVTGQGQWQGGYGGSVGAFSGSLQLSGGYGTMQAQPNIVRVLAGQDPYNPQGGTGYYMWGNFPLTCDMGAVVN